ncbi:hypothetical protein KI387_005515 [Taxus chinensis]|uniref:Phospholipid/glycerol acyltransferase domain-containing protein n=1 Tax=Taxus chinensis TaxID=29808 RepID=A0AA38GNU9_TAXCH|nr:hypothetical protein KI387_005515 [Taxus chinensis]
MDYRCSGTIANCVTRNRQTNSVVSDFEGALLHRKNAFSYFMLVAFEASGILRFALLLLSWPVYAVLYYFISEAAGLRVLIFVALVGLRVSEIESAGRAVLPKFYMEDLNCETWRVFSSFGRRVVVTSSPRVMVESFLKRHVQAEEVIGTEIEVNRFGRATGFVKVPGVLLGLHKRFAVKALFGDATPTVGLGREIPVERSFMALCQESYVVPANQRKDTTDDVLPKPPPVIFHDGRLVRRPTPLSALLILIYIPLGMFLAIFRILAGFLLPIWAIHHTSPYLGGKIIVNGEQPQASSRSNAGRPGVLYVCTHRTLLDPVILSIILKRRIPAVTYSISRLSELLSPIPTVRLTRQRERDAANIRSLLQRGDLVVCPEGTTCREPFLLRFSSLFAELSDQIVPVAMDYRVSLFYGSTARGWKGMDPFFFFMNPRPEYRVTFLKQIPHRLTCSAGKSPHEVANYVQRLLARTLGFECTGLTRREKYSILAGNDGTVSSSSSRWLGLFTHRAQN